MSRAPRNSGRGSWASSASWIAAADARTRNGAGPRFEFRVGRVGIDRFDRSTEVVIIMGQRTCKPGAAGEDH